MQPYAHRVCGSRVGVLGENERLAAEARLCRNSDARQATAGSCSRKRDGRAGSPPTRPLTGDQNCPRTPRYVTYALNTTLLSPSHMRADFSGPPAALSAL